MRYVKDNFMRGEIKPTQDQIELNIRKTRKISEKWKNLKNSENWNFENVMTFSIFPRGLIDMR